MESIIPGYYYHYKHDPSISINNFAYRVLGIGLHTEDDCLEIDKYMVVYRPLYDTFAYRNGKMYDLRPLKIFVSPASKNGKLVDRYVKITDPEIIKTLEEIQRNMYE